MKKRAIAGIVLVGLLGVSATSLGVHRAFLEGRLEASKATTDLSSSIEKIDGVSSVSAVYTPLAVPEPTVTVSVTFAPDAPIGSWGRAREAVDVAMRSADLTGATATATFRETDGRATAVVDGLSFSRERVASEITTWHSMLASAEDVISLRLGHDSTSTDGQGALTREYTVASSADVVTAAAAWPVRGFDVDATLPTRWTSPGIQLRSIPTRAVMATVAKLSNAVPLAPALSLPKKPGVYAVVLGDLGGYKVDFLSVARGRPADLPLDKRLSTAARIALAGGAVRVEWVRASGTASLVAGSCGSYQKQGQSVATTFTANARSLEFAAALVRAGGALPADVRPGVCQE